MKKKVIDHNVKGLRNKGIIKTLLNKNKELKLTKEPLHFKH